MKKNYWMGLAFAKLENVTVTFPPKRSRRKDTESEIREFIALNGVSFPIYRDKITVIAGPNGSGKSTAIRVLTNLLPYQGSVQIAGNEVSDRPQEIQKLVSRCASGEVYGEYTALENLKFSAELRGIEWTSIKPWCLRFLDELQFEQENLETQAKYLSRGNQQKIAIVRAVMAKLQNQQNGAQDGSLLVLDEPTANLDERARARVHEIIRWVRDRFGVAILVATNDMREAEAIADYCVCIENGSVIARGTPEELKREAGGVNTLIEAFLALTTNDEVCPLSAELDGLSRMAQIRPAKLWPGEAFLRKHWRGVQRDRPLLLLVILGMIMPPLAFIMIASNSPGANAEFVSSITLASTLWFVCSSFLREFGMIVQRELRDGTIEYLFSEPISDNCRIAGFTACSVLMTSIFSGVYLLGLGLLWSMGFVEFNAGICVGPNAAPLMCTLLFIACCAFGLGLAMLLMPVVMDGPYSWFANMTIPWVAMVCSELYYPLARFPGVFQWGCWLNPITYAVRALRCFFNAELPGSGPLAPVCLVQQWTGLSEGAACCLILMAAAIVVPLLGYRVFQGLKMLASKRGRFKRWG